MPPTSSLFAKDTTATATMQLGRVMERRGATRGLPATHWGYIRNLPRLLVFWVLPPIRTNKLVTHHSYFLTL